MSRGVHPRFPDVIIVSLVQLVALAPPGDLTELYMNVLASVFGRAGGPRKSQCRP
jgi:hypothetical protein